MIYEEIKKGNVEAIKAKDSVARGIYSVVLNKLMLEGIRRREKGEELTDADVVGVLQKAVKELAEEAENYIKAGNQAEADNIKEQIKIVEKYLPEMLSKEKIKEIILALPDKSIPYVMKHFKANYNGKCDMRLVQEVLKEVQ